jgi:hypothetical protein
MRKLRKAERPIVDDAVGSAFDRVLPELHMIEGVMEQLLVAVPVELGEHALHEFMNRLGTELMRGFTVPPAPELEEG